MEIPLIAIGVLVVLVLVYAVIVIFLPGFKVPAQKLKASADFPENDSMGDPRREEVAFEVEGDKIHAWFYLPADTSGKVPCVVLGHGLGGTKACGLGKYASRFQQAGFAALAFDYRFFGESGGEPRQLIWIPHQLEDYRAAIAYARWRPEVDPDRIAVWGSSFSGGHAIVLASKDRRIACVASQVPGLDPHASLKEHFSWAHAAQLLRLIPHGQRDMFRGWLDLSPHRVPLVGKPGTVALMTSPQAYEQFPSLTPDGFVNEACARIIVRADKYRPVKYARDVKCPVLLQICDRDELIPVSSAQGTIDALEKLAEVRHYPIGHFDIYFGEHFEQAVRDQIAFFKAHLLK
jgi:uncharacterized protein